MTPMLVRQGCHDKGLQTGGSRNGNACAQASGGGKSEAGVGKVDFL